MVNHLYELRWSIVQNLILSLPCRKLLKDFFSYEVYLYDAAWTWNNLASVRLSRLGSLRVTRRNATSHKVTLSYTWGYFSLYQYNFIFKEKRLDINVLRHRFLKIWLRMRKVKVVFWYQISPREKVLTQKSCTKFLTIDSRGLKKSKPKQV
jgi:hypothetical protein